MKNGFYVSGLVSGTEGLCFLTVYSHLVNVYLVILILVIKFVSSFSMPFEIVFLLLISSLP